MLDLSTFPTSEVSLSYNNHMHTFAQETFKDEASPDNHPFHYQYFTFITSQPTAMANV